MMRAHLGMRLVSCMCVRKCRKVSVVSFCYLFHMCIHCYDIGSCNDDQGA